MATNPDHHPTSTRPWHDDWTTAAHDQRPLAGSMGAALGQMTGQIQARLAEVERRHAEALRDMQVKLERMSGEAGRARPALPADLANAFGRIESGMADLVDRIAETTPSRRRSAETFVFGAAKPDLSQFVIYPPARKPIAPIDAPNGSSGTGEPWDADSAEALAHLYESGEALLGKHLPEAALFARQPPAARLQPETSVKHSGQPAPQPSAPAAAAGLGGDRVWLEQRFNGIADHVSKSMLEARSNGALATLLSRVDQLETRFGTALDSLAQSAKAKGLGPDALRQVEAQIKELAGHIESTQKHLARLDTIERHLSELTAFAHASMAEEASAPAAIEPAHDFAQLADLAVERALSRLPAAQTAVAPAEAQHRIDAVHALLQDFVTEHRRGDQYTSGMLDTVQEALIRLIDRVDAIDAGNSGYALAAPELPHEIDATPAAAMAASIEQPAPEPAPQAVPVLRPESTPKDNAAVHVAAAPAPAAEIGSAPTQTIRRRAPRTVETVTAPVSEAAPAEVAPEAQPEISIKDLRQKTRRVPIIAAAPPAEEAAKTAEVPVAAKPMRTTRAPVPQSSGAAGKRGMAIAAVALGLVGISYLASLLLADRYGGIMPPSAPATKPVVMTEPRSTPVAAVPVTSTQPPTASSTQPPGMVPPSDAQRVRNLPTNGTNPVTQPAVSEPAGSVGQRTNAAPAPGTDTSSTDRTAKPKPPASVPETVTDDLSLNADNEPELVPVSTTPPAAPQSAPKRTLQPMQGMALDTTAPMPRLAELAGIQRQSSLAAASEQLGYRARPASDFSGRFANASPSAAAQPIPAPVASSEPAKTVSAPQALQKPAAAIVTGSNPSPPAEQASFGAAPKAPAAPLDSAASDTVSETADLPPALIGPLSLRMAAAKGDPSASFEVATRFAEGRGIKQDFKQAMTWYQRSAAKGLAVAQYRLGTLYERGLGTPVDIARARIWYKRAADQGNVKSMHNLAVLSAGHGQSAPDYAGAAKWFKDAADHGLADSQFNLGVLNENGLGVPKDPRAAYVWFSLAARSGDNEAIRRRDLLIATLDSATLKAADEQVKGWRARPTDVKINDARVAGDQWRSRAAQIEDPQPPQPPVAPLAPQLSPAAPAPAESATGTTHMRRAPAPQTR